jgi:hypothetical protein
MGLTLKYTVCIVFVVPGLDVMVRSSGEVKDTVLPYT